MYNQSLKHKWDNENAMDYAIETVKEEADQKARQEERAKGDKEKKEMAVVLKNKNVAIDIIVEATKLSTQEIEAL